jgi:GNAT superfamily N-acetyltransferase
MNNYPDVKIERSKEKDVKILAKISKKAFETDLLDGIAPSSFKTPGGPPGYDSPDFHKFIMSVLDVYNILLEGEVVGGLLLNSHIKRHCILERIFVAPTHHKKGVGGKAMEVVHQNYPEADIWTLGTPKWNSRTRNFYEKLGYVQVGWEKSPDPIWWGVWYQKTIRPYEFQKINQLVDNMQSIDLEGEITEIPVPKEVTLKNDNKARVTNAKLTDDSGIIDLVLWENRIDTVEVGDKVRLENVIVDSYQGNLQVKIKYGRIIHLL